MSRRQRILDTASGLVSKFMYYDRKEDEDLPRGAIQAAVKAGEITADEIVDRISVLIRAAVDE